MAGAFTKEMSIKDIVMQCPESVEVFAQFGLGCIGCAMASFETLEQGALAHGIDVNQLVDELNKKAESSTGKKGGCSCCG